jgi:hypothetical protein
MWHPDKISQQRFKRSTTVQNTKHHFKVLVESYEYIINKMRSIGLNSSKREHIQVQK